MIDGVYTNGFFIGSLAGMALNQFFQNFLEAVPSPRNVSIKIPVSLVGLFNS